MTLATPCNNIIGPGLTMLREPGLRAGQLQRRCRQRHRRQPNVAAAIIADAVTLLSNDWNDIRSFTDPGRLDPARRRDDGYRMAIVTGKAAFPKPAGADASFGSDGGAHNFVRRLEDWNRRRGSPLPRLAGQLLLSTGRASGRSSAATATPTSAATATGRSTPTS